MGKLRKFEDDLKDTGRKIDDQILQPVKNTVEAVIDDPKKLAVVAAMFAFPGAAASLGSFLAPASSALVQSAIGSALIQGTVAEATGGDFVKGAIAGAIGGGLSASTVGAQIGSSLGITNQALASNVGTALAQGTLTEITGGDFIDGAISSVLANSGQYVGETFLGLQGVTASTVGASLVNGLAAELRGKDVTDAMISGAVTGALTYKEDPNKQKNAQFDEDFADMAAGKFTVDEIAEGQDLTANADLKGMMSPRPTVPVVQPVNTEPVFDATEREGSLAKAPVAPAFNWQDSVKSGVKALGAVSAANIIEQAAPDPTRDLYPVNLEYGDIYRDAPIKGFSMRKDATGRHIPYIGDTPLLAKGGFVSKKKTTPKSAGLASRRN